MILVVSKRQSDEVKTRSAPPRKKFAIAKYGKHTLRKRVPVPLDEGELVLKFFKAFGVEMTWAAHTEQEMNIPPFETQWRVEDKYGMSHRLHLSYELG